MNKQDVNFSWNQKEFWNNIFHPEGNCKLYVPPKRYCNICGKDHELHRGKFIKNCLCDETEYCPKCGMANCRRNH